MSNFSRLLSGSRSLRASCSSWTTSKRPMQSVVVQKSTSRASSSMTDEADNQLTRHPDIMEQMTDEADNQLTQHPDIMEQMTDEADNRLTKYPNIMEPDILYDSASSEYFRAKSGRLGKVNLRNDPSYMAVDKELNESIKDEGEAEGEMDEEKDAALTIADLPTKGFHRYPLIHRRVTQQTGKGKMHRQYFLVVVGNGDGLVGYGEGKHDEMLQANNKAYIEAVRNMDYVERFEKRTIWTDMEIKLGSTRILMRPRPVGFGLHCNPNIHQVLKAAGIKDVSAKVWGSRNPINVIKATCMLIQSGNAPLSMGNGVGGKGRRLDAGSGMRSKESVERDRGRKLLDGRTW